MKLRPYQEETVQAVYRYLREHDDNPCAVLPTAAGKSVVLARIANDAATLWDGRVLILAHVQELLEQNADKIAKLAPDVPVGIYSAGLGSRDTLAPVIVAGIQSAYRRAGELGRFDLAIVDEAHLVPESGDGMYRTLLAELKTMNPLLRVIGFTATPFRMSSGPICAHENILNSICYEISIRELIRDGYLCPLITKSTRNKIDTGSLHVRGGEFVASEVEQLMDENARVEAACREIVDLARQRSACLIFASGVKHGRHVAQTLQSMGQRVATIFGDTLDHERERTVADFRAGRLKYLVNVNVLTTGFDAPSIDCIAMLRPTLSPGLWYQCCGRGFRVHPGKKDCLILDFGGNALRHGPVDALKVKGRGEHGEGPAPAKECPACNAVISAGYAVCPHCGQTFERERSQHEATASSAGVLTGQVSTVAYPVTEILYAVHVKRSAPADAPRSMRVDYRIGFNRWQSEWICFEHSGFARHKAEQWWRRRSVEPLPETAEEAVELAEAGVLCGTKSITIRSVAGERFDRIVGYELNGTSPKPEPEYVPADDSIPF
jgi:DNA repair protein RadD